MRRDSDGYLLALPEVLHAVYDELTVKPGRSIIAPGQEVAWDDCCDGQLAVRVANVSARYASQGRGCPIGYTLTVGVSLVRCVAKVSDQGRAPSAAVITGDGHNTLRDMREIARALQCYTADDIDTSILDTWTPLGPQGGCAGGEWILNWRVGSNL